MNGRGRSWSRAARSIKRSLSSLKIQRRCGAGYTHIGQRDEFAIVDAMAWLESNVLAYTFLDDYLLRYYFVLINCNKLRHRANSKSKNSPFECRRFLFKNETDYSTCNLSNVEENEMAFDS